ncbi:hypothetical protein HF289_07590 [Acidithiobacillus ferrooxidans]|uniref:hypothetical protein n=1 Tax=Acidithiobacillus ferrooxidans TaxID=920 RepID=UPI001C06EEF4|nr:hypothetical protein [Acidithiobacillus ferrooxidans]MBU2856746.1 hypothetical protein [Acidithiobacillus ferrooxidans]
MIATIDKYIKVLPDVLSTLVSGDERLYAKVYQEETQYARLTQARVNQNGGIFQEQLTLFLSNGLAMVSMSVEGNLPSPDQIRGLVQSLREDLPYVPRDPWLNLNETPKQIETGSTHGSMHFDELVNTLCESAGKQDLVGLVLSGPQVFAVCSSLGHCLIHRGGGSSIDVSFFDADYNAVKRVRRDPELADILPLMNGMSQDLKALRLFVGLSG